MVLLLILVAAGFSSCKKGPEVEAGSSRIAVGGINMDKVKATSSLAISSIVSAGLKNLTDHGFCWSTTPMPDISSQHISLGSATSPGPFKYAFTGLIPLTAYYIRAYVIDDKQYIMYSQQKIFTTLELTLPTVSTDSVSMQTSTTALCGGVINKDGNGNIAASGVCWVIGGAPSLNHCNGYTTDTGAVFTSHISGLLPDTSYQLTAYATNEMGTAYGAVRTFSTRLPCGQATVVYGSITYHSVLIGTQCWMKENLNIGERINGSQNQDPLNLVVQKYCFNDDETNCTLYGGLYQWDEVMRSSATPGGQGICPKGWHLPADDEWTVLTAFLGGDSVAGTKLKSATGWYNNGNGTNTSGFTALPGGNRGNDGSFNNLTQLGYFWTSSQAGSSEAWNRKLSADTSLTTKYNSFKTNGFSVRCVRNP